jgi:hypothetical protein
MIVSGDRLLDGVINAAAIFGMNAFGEIGTSEGFTRLKAEQLAAIIIHVDV